MIVDRFEEGLRLADVDQDGHVQPRARLPHRVELGVVDTQAAAVGFRVEHAEILENLEPAGARLDVVFELLRRLRDPAGTDAAEVDVGEQHHAIVKRTVANGAQTLAQALAAAAAQVYEDLEIVRVHSFGDALELGG